MLMLPSDTTIVKKLRGMMRNGKPIGCGNCMGRHSLWLYYSQRMQNSAEAGYFCGCGVCGFTYPAGKNSTIAIRSFVEWDEGKEQGE